MAKDRDYCKMIHTARWRKLRASVLTAHPLCELCELHGELTPASVVHHRIPVESALTYAEKERLMFREANLEALCPACHVERHKSLGRSGKAATARLRASQGAEFRRLFYGEEASEAE